MRQIIIFILLVSSPLVYSQEVSVEEVNAILDEINGNTHSLRAEEISQKLLGRTYVSGPCGEGTVGIYDKKPLACFNKFDCTTFVESVLALSFVDPNADKDFYEQFIHNLKNIKYCNAEDICFVNRNHFVSINWNPNAIAKNYLFDITQDIYPESPERIKTLNVDKWYQDKIDEMSKNNDPEKEKKITDLKKESVNKSVSHEAHLFYIPLDIMLTSDIQEKLKNEKILVFNLVKDEHTVADVPVIVGHQGFIILKDNQLFFRHASSFYKQSVDTPFVEYINLRKADSKWPSLGFNILQIK